jgi:hypothetical protein
MSNDRRSARLRHTHSLTDLDLTGLEIDASQVVSGILDSARLPGSFSGFANPSASIGLTAVNGSATTAMRSDAAPALSQAIVPTWTAQHTFALSGTHAAPSVQLSSARPILHLNETDGAADNRRGAFEPNSETLQLSAADDTGSAATVWCRVDRTGTAVDAVTFAQGTKFFGSFGSVPVPNNEVARLYLGGSVPLIGFVATGAGSNAKVTDFFANPTTGALSFRLVNDALTSATEWMSVSRVATAVGTVNFPTTSAVGFLLGPNAGIFTNRMVAMNGAATPGILGITQSSGVSGNDVLALHHTATSGDNLLAQFVTDAGSTRGSISYNRGAGLVAYNTTSDVRLKRDIKDAQPASDIIDSIRVREFTWRDSGNVNRYGFIAQELHEVYPDAATKAHGHVPWQVDYSKLVPLMLKEIQSLRARVRALESDNDVS